MTYDELTQEIKKLNLDEIREELPGVFEFTIRTEHLNQLQSILESYFGIPFKPAGQRPTREAKKYAKSLGGVWENQTLYFIEDEQSSNCAVIWPWSNGEVATVKVAKC